MAGETIITIVGNLTADPELRHTQNGIAVANFTIASTPRVFDRQANEYKDGDPLFLRASAWREFGEHIAGSLQKGTRVIAQGELKVRTFQREDGTNGTSTELAVTAIGPELRYATATVQRVPSGQGGGGFGGGQPQGQPWGQQQGGGQPQNTWSAAQPGSQGDQWQQPGGQYNDETPF